MSLDTFEQSLLGELRQHVAARTPAGPDPRRIWTGRLAVAGLAAAGTAAVAVAVGLVTSVVTPTAAYAVEAQPDGDVVVTIHDLSDASGLEHALSAYGIAADVSYRADASQPDGEARTSTHGDGAACDIALAKVDGGLRFTLGAAQVASRAELVIVTSGSSPTDVGSPVEVAWSGGSC